MNIPAPQANADCAVFDYFPIYRWIWSDSFVAPPDGFQPALAVSSLAIPGLVSKFLRELVVDDGLTLHFASQPCVKGHSTAWHANIVRKAG